MSTQLPPPLTSGTHQPPDHRAAVIGNFRSVWVGRCLGGWRIDPGSLSLAFPAPLDGKVCPALDKVCSLWKWFYFRFIDTFCQEGERGVLAPPQLQLCVGRCWFSFLFFLALLWHFGSCSTAIVFKVNHVRAITSCMTEVGFNEKWLAHWHLTTFQSWQLARLCKANCIL